MTFKSMSELEAYVNRKIEAALIDTREKINDILEDFLHKYYAEFSPKVYERTFQLMTSLVKTDVINTGNGKKVEVYFDVSALDYSVKYRNGAAVPNRGWSEEKVLDAAAHGSHGGYVTMTPIFYGEPLNIINEGAIKTLVGMLKKHGIPIK